jgi:hypothetical protein
MIWHPCVCFGGGIAPGFDTRNAPVTLRSIGSTATGCHRGCLMQAAGLLGGVTYFTPCPLPKVA